MVAKEAEEDELIDKNNDNNSKSTITRRSEGSSQRFMGECEVTSRSGGGDASEGRRNASRSGHAWLRRIPAIRAVRLCPVLDELEWLLQQFQEKDACCAAELDRST